MATLVWPIWLPAFAVLWPRRQAIRAWLIRRNTRRLLKSAYYRDRRDLDRRLRRKT